MEFLVFCIVSYLSKLSIFRFHSVLCYCKGNNIDIIWDGNSKHLSLYTFNATARSACISQRAIESPAAIKWNSTRKKKNRLAYHYGAATVTRFTECDSQFCYRWWRCSKPFIFILIVITFQKIRCNTVT